MKFIVNSFLVFILICQSANSQYLKFSTLASGGGTENNSSGYISQVIGQSSIVVGTSSTQGVIFRQGFKQPVIGKKKGQNTSALQATSEQIKWSIVAFPNPFSKWVTVQFSSLTQNPIFLQLYDIQGSIMFESSYPSGITEIRLEKFQFFAPGKYILRVFEKDKLQSLSLIKQLD